MRVYRISYLSLTEAPPYQEADAIMIAGQWHEVPPGCETETEALAGARPIDEMAERSERTLYLVRDLRA